VYSRQFAKMKFEEKDKPWPFRPNHITCDGKERGLKGTGIITSRHLQGIQSEICHAVQHPTTIIEFAEDGMPVRTDSPLLTYVMHTACDRFRLRNFEVDENKKVIIDKNGEPVTSALCMFSDNCHACIFQWLCEDELTIESVKDRKGQVTNLNGLYTSASECLFEPKICNERLFLQYDCPLLGYRELLFPVVFEGKVIAVFFVGQITLEGQKNFIEDMIRSISSRFPDCFNPYLQRYNGTKTPESIAEEILQAHRSWLDEEPDERILSISKYEEIICNTIEEIKNFEGLLAEDVDHQRIAYIRNNVSREVEEFVRSSEPLGGSEKVDDDTLESLWGRVQDSMDRLVDSFSLRYAFVFGVKRIIHAPQEKLEVVAKTPRWKEVFHSENELLELCIDTEDFPDGYLVCSRDENEKYVDCLEGCDLNDLGDFQLLLVSVATYRYSSIAILVGYDEEHPRTSPENQPGSVLNSTLQSFDTLVVSSLAAILARGAEDNARRQLLYLGHEAGQLVEGLDWLRMFYFENAWSLKSQPIKKIRDMCNDLEGFIGQMAFIFNMASQMGTDALPEVEMEVFKPFGEVLFKWKDTYRHDIRKKCLQIRVADLDPRDPWRPEIYADKFLFEQVVYNLVNNAEKYSYRGTKIDLDCKLKSLDDDRSPHVLTVTNYGRYMAPGRDVYLPFTRRETEGDVAGLGLGLYIAWLIIVRVHDGEISHYCDEEPVSRFNIPLIKPYIERIFEGKDLDLAVELEDEMDRLRALQQYNSIVAFSDIKRTPKYYPSDDALSKEIHKSTYKVTINAIIPLQERRDK